MCGRVKDGVSIDHSRAEMRTIQARPALILQIAVGFVLPIACANTGNLLLGRAVARDKEIAVRTAMGAGHWRLFRQTLTESMLLSGAAALLGLLLSLAGVRLLLAMAPPDAFALHELRIDRSVLLFTALVAIVTGRVGIPIRIFAAQYPAHRCPCLRFTCRLATARARLAVRMVSLSPFL